MNKTQHRKLNIAEHGLYLGLTQVLRKDKQFLLHIHPSCYSGNKPDDTHVSHEFGKQRITITTIRTYPLLL